MADDMPTTYDYDNPPPEQSNKTQDSGRIGPQMEYLKSLQGILKIVEIFVSIICFICASINSVWISYGGGWVQFVSMTAFILTILLFLLFFLNIIPKIPGPVTLIIFIYYAVCTVFYLIAGIVAAARAGYIYYEGDGTILSSSPIGAASFFAFAAAIVFGVDTFFQFRTWRSGGSSPRQATTTTTTTTTTETYPDPTGPQY